MNTCDKSGIISYLKIKDYLHHAGQIMFCRRAAKVSENCQIVMRKSG